jgi:hypothetical protein
MSEIDEEKTIRSYLLGVLSQEERARLEERLLADDAYFQELLLVEEDLIDDYLGGELTPEERVQLEGHFLSAPERQQDLRFAKAFKKYVASSAIKKQSEVASGSPGWLSSLRTFFLTLRPPKPRLLLSLAATLAIVIGGFWFIRRWSRPEPVITRNETTAPTPVAQQEQTPNPNNNEVVVRATPSPVDDGGEGTQNTRPPARDERPKSSVMTVALASGLVREGGEIKRVKVRPETALVRLQLELDPTVNDYESYGAVLQSGSGQVVLSRKDLHAGATSRGKIITLEIPARLLKRDDYYLKLSGRNSAKEFEPAGTYGFRVIE